MSLLASLAALAWEHFRPRRPVLPLVQARRWHGWLLTHLNAGGERHGALAWVLGAALPALLALWVEAMLAEWWPPAGWLWAVAVLYFCLAFRPGLSRALEVAAALLRGDAEAARLAMQAWRPGILVGADRSSLARQVLEETLRLAQTRLFGPWFWFILFSAPGALLYLLSREARDCWHGAGAFGGFASRIQEGLDWLPSRALAFSFAIVGNFQDAMECWRGQARAWGNLGEGAVLAAGSGALGLRLGGRVQLPDGNGLARPELGLEEPAGPESLAAAEALIWRAALLWLAVLTLVALGRL